MNLEPYQIRGRDALIHTRRGIVKSPAGSGKTIIAAAALNGWVPPRARIGRRRIKVAWIAHTTDQCDQAHTAIAAFPKIADHADITVACYASALNLSGFELTILDECHHVAAQEYRKMLDGHQGWRWGLSATPNREDDLQADVFELIGPIVCAIARHEVAETGRLAKAIVIIHQPNFPGEFVDAISERSEDLYERWKAGAKHAARQLCELPINRVLKYRSQEDQEILQRIHGETNISPNAPVVALFKAFPKGNPLRKQLWALMLHTADIDIKDRSRWIAAQDIGIFRNEKRSAKVIYLGRKHAEDCTLIIIGKIEHGQELSAQIPGSEVIFSKMGVTKRRSALERFKSGELRTVFATSLADEGLDVPRANTLILAAAGRSASKAEQRTGRVLRSFHDKTHGTIHDFMDVQHPYLLAQSKRRIKVYRDLGYEISFADEKKGGLI